MPETCDPSQTTITRESIRYLIDPLQRFLLIEAADGGILLIATGVPAGRCHLGAPDRRRHPGRHRVHHGPLYCRPCPGG